MAVVGSFARFTSENFQNLGGGSNGKFAKEEIT